MEMALLFLSALFPDKRYHKKTADAEIINSFFIGHSSNSHELFNQSSPY